MRSGPGVSYESVGELARGECLTYLNETRYDAGGHAWYKAQYYSYGEVWVSSVYSELTYTRTEASVDDEAGTYGRYIQATGQLNVRSGPGLRYSELGMLKNGATAAYLGEHSTDERGVTWYKISYNGRQRLGLLPLLHAALTDAIPEARASGIFSSRGKAAAS